MARHIVLIMMMKRNFLSHQFPFHSIILIAVCRIGFCSVKRNSDRGLYLRSSGHGRGCAASSAFRRRRSVSADCVDFADDFDRAPCEPLWLPDVITLPITAAVGACTTGCEGCVEADETRVGSCAWSWLSMAPACMWTFPPDDSDSPPGRVRTTSYWINGNMYPLDFVSVPRSPTPSGLLAL